MDLQKEITILEKKLKSDSFASELRGMTVKELEFKLLQLSNHREEIVTTKNDDDQYQSAKELVKEMAAPYNEQMKMNKIKSRFIHLLLKEKQDEATHSDGASISTPNVQLLGRAD